MEPYPPKPNPAIDPTENLSAPVHSFDVAKIVQDELETLAFSWPIHGGAECDVHMVGSPAWVSGVAAWDGVTDENLSWEPADKFLEQALDPVGGRNQRMMSGHFLAQIWAGDTRFLTALSGLIHLLLLCILTLVPTHGTGGDETHTTSGVAVRLVEPFDVTPVEESPGSKDSQASLPAVAKRSPILENKSQQTQDPQNRDLLEQSPLGLKAIPALQKTEEERPPRETERSDTRLAAATAAIEDSLATDSPVTYDSAYSLPSSSSPERRTNSTAAAAGNEYRNKIISAISDAAYYPKKALIEKVYGETVVSFTVNKNGALLSVNISKPSGYEILDNAALTIIKKASQKFPSIPDDVMYESLSYEVPIIFKRRS
jgi:protein TonB